jgi:hypothetical protein
MYSGRGRGLALFVFLFLAAQASLLAHGVTHAVEGVAHESVCDLCLAQQHQGNALPSVFVFLPDTLFASPRADDAVPGPDAVLPQPRQRGPPQGS